MLISHSPHIIIIDRSSLAVRKDRENSPPYIPIIPATRKALPLVKLNVITGATGLLGSHVVENLVARGERVRAFVRATSDTAFLKALGVELAVGDLTDRDAFRKAIEGADIVYHCAARVRDWGPWSAFQADIVDATTLAVEVAAVVGVGRFLHVSSISAYGHPAGAYGPTTDALQEFTEDTPLGQHPAIWDYYPQAKTITDQRVQQSPLPWTIVRPSSLYGVRDRSMLPRAMKALAAGRVALIGSGDNQLNLVYAGDVAEGAVRAANAPAALRRAYNLTSPGEISQREFLDLLTTELGIPPVRRRVPYRLAYWGGLFSEIVGKLIRIQRSPHLTRHGIGLMGRSTRFSSRRAHDELGWRPAMPIQKGLRLALDWQKQT